MPCIIWPLVLGLIVIAIIFSIVAVFQTDHVIYYLSLALDHPANNMAASAAAAAGGASAIPMTYLDQQGHEHQHRKRGKPPPPSRQKSRMETFKTCDLCVILEQFLSKYIGYGGGV